ncbi:hypothetical protein D3C86_1910170 [compost metagenome]
MTRVMPNRARAEKRVARPSRISSGNRCSLTAASCAASAGASSGSWYSCSNSGMAEAESRGRPNSKVPETISMARPSILVCPDFQKVAAIEKRARKAIRL